MMRARQGLSAVLAGLLLLLPAAAPCRAASYKLSTWNLDWFTLRDRAQARLPDDVTERRAEDIDRLRFYADRLAADVVAFQEVDGSAAAARLFDPAVYAIASITEPVTQRVGLAVRRPIRILAATDYAELDIDPEAAFPLRDGLDATLGFPGGQTLRVLVVHLKSGCQEGALGPDGPSACARLAQQIAPLARWAAARAAEGAAFAIMGDFNRVLDRPEAMGAALAAAAPLIRVTAGHATPCWDGARFIDHILLGGAARDWLEPGSLRVQIFREEGRAWRHRLSDHCPVSIMLSPPNRP